MKFSIIFLCFQLVENARILGIFHHPSKSHHVQGSALLKGLARKGHQVTMVSPFAFKNPVENYTDIKLIGLRELKEKYTSFSLMGVNGKSSMKNYFKMEEYFMSLIEPTLNNTGLKSILTEKYDLVVISWAFNDIFLTLGNVFQSPIILYNTIGEDSMVENVYRNSYPLSYIPNSYMPFSCSMSFSERLQNTLFSTFLQFYTRTIYLDKQEELRKKYFPNSPPIRQLIYNVSLILTNSHWSFSYAKPEVPFMVNVGGLHLEKSRKLPQRILNFLEDSPYVIFVNLGSTTSNFPQEKLNVLLNSFSKISGKILWKFDGNFENIPENVVVDNWLSQNDILGHVNVRCFVTHGNSLSFTEAIFHGVPMVVIPLFSEQKFNAAKVSKMSIGVRLNYRDLNEELLTSAINQVLYNTTYLHNIKQRQEMLTNPAVEPLDLAIYWVEHVLKYKNTYLKPEGNNLYWFQLYLLDVIIVIILILTVLVSIMSCTIRTIIRQISKRSHNKKKVE